ncbi:hypothetical protein RND81_14G160000 [Saponaria officinalis]|uniref:Reverse transcriptase zinc-binding domain-containing protein n=1 Tax=Saponaria officinalis TaxID=3572 RepID=A0AAW1GMF9_SAPOF
MYERLQTKLRLDRFGYGGDLRCCLCAVNEESLPHLFFECQYSSKCVQLVAVRLGINIPVSDTWKWWNQSRFSSLFHKKVIGEMLCAIIYRIWKARNHSLHNSVLIRPEMWMKDLICNTPVHRIVPTRTETMKDGVTITSNEDMVARDHKLTIFKGKSNYIK